jgi:hypothetical protein
VQTLKALLPAEMLGADEKGAVEEIAAGDRLAQPDGLTPVFAARTGKVQHAVLRLRCWQPARQRLNPRVSFLSQLNGARMSR